MIESTLAVLAAVLAGPTTPIPLNDPDLVAATAAIKECGRLPEKLPTFLESEALDPLYCGLYDPERNLVVINPDQSNCDSRKDTLIHEMLHAVVGPHPSDKWIRDTTKDPFAVAAHACGIADAPEEYTDPKPYSLLFEGTTSSSHVKRLAFGVNVALSEGNPFDIGARIGVFNWVNIREFGAYSTFAHLELGYSVSAGPVYLRVAQGAALVGTGPYKNPERPERGRMGLATLYQFPTSLEVGVRRADGWKLGLLAIHYSNGGVGQGSRVYNGLGVSIGRAF